MRSIRGIISIVVGAVVYILVVFLFPAQGIRVAIAGIAASSVTVLISETRKLAKDLLNSFIAVILGVLISIAFHGGLGYLPAYIGKTRIIGALLFLVPFISMLSGTLIASGIKNMKRK